MSVAQHTGGGPDPGWEDLDLPGAVVRLYRDAFAPAERARLFERLRSEVSWRQERVTMFGREVALPRLTAWYGGAAYRYSGLRMAPAAWTPLLAGVRARVESLSGIGFDSVLLNLYRDGRDAVSWHSDDEPELGPDPPIASVSLGAVRAFQLRPRAGGEPLRLDLPDGSLLLMTGPTQHNWRHRVPRTAKPVGARINLTFRRIVSART